MFTQIQRKKKYIERTKRDTRSIEDTDEFRRAQRSMCNVILKQLSTVSFGGNAVASRAHSIAATRYTNRAYTQITTTNPKSRNQRNEWSVCSSCVVCMCARLWTLFTFSKNRYVLIRAVPWLVEYRVIARRRFVGHDSCFVFFFIRFLFWWVKWMEVCASCLSI